MHIPTTKNLILGGSRIVSLTAFKGLVHKLSVLLLSKDLCTHCQSNCFQKTCAHIVSLIAFKGLGHTLEVGTKYP
jgi:hypothetical protein